ncbi:hypothetical protein QNI19_05820 [Cytophagaceae bacterium DM2B3-1]|uniref:Uncharacterized protein n=1 Tax=Xanthocytophaga flava TaxID=3048013 RepID=A0ABT7CFE6_9BACT|nr:hypothetical protein [Xanthocytophaga flavus]MDJ1492438.1 hypothetical protein [Xanthocytophaga flavus]
MSARVDNSNPDPNSDGGTTSGFPTTPLPGFPGLPGIPGFPPKNKGILVSNLPVNLATSIDFIFTYDNGVIKDAKAEVKGVVIGIIFKVNSWTQTKYYSSINTYVIEIVCDQGIGFAIDNLDVINAFSYRVKYVVVVSPDKSMGTVYTYMLASNNPSVKPGPINYGSPAGSGGTIPGGSTPGGDAGSPGGTGGIPTWVLVPKPSDTAEPPLDDHPQGAQPSYARVTKQ